MAERLALPDCEETIFYKALCDVLQKDPVLKRVVKEWITYDGSKIENHTENQLPCIDVVLSEEGTAQRASVNVDQTTMMIDINLTVDGTDVSDLLNLWAAVRRCVASSNLIRQTLNLRISKPAYSVLELNDQQIMSGGGVLAADFYVQVGPIPCTNC